MFVWPLSNELEAMAVTELISLMGNMVTKLSLPARTLAACAGINNGITGDARLNFFW